MREIVPLWGLSREGFEPPTLALEVRCSILIKLSTFFSYTARRNRAVAPLRGATAGLCSWTMPSAFTPQSGATEWKHRKAVQLRHEVAQRPHEVGQLKAKAGIEPTYKNLQFSA